LVQYPRFAYLWEAAEETEHLWVRVLQDGVARGAFRADLDPHMAYRFMRDAIWVSVRWYRPDGSLTPDGVADQYLDVLMRGIDQNQER
jgi:hypothetical protein